MKGRYNGCIMNVYCSMPGYKRLANIPRLSKEATRRLKWFDYYNYHDHNARLAYRHFDISPQTFYRWKQSYNFRHLETPGNRPHRCRHASQTIYSAELGECV